MVADVEFATCAIRSTNLWKEYYNEFVAVAGRPPSSDEERDIEDRIQLELELRDKNEEIRID